MIKDNVQRSEIPTKRSFIIFNMDRETSTKLKEEDKYEINNNAETGRFEEGDWSRNFHKVNATELGRVSMGKNAVFKVNTQGKAHWFQLGTRTSQEHSVLGRSTYGY